MTSAYVHKRSLAGSLLGRERTVNGAKVHEMGNVDDVNRCVLDFQGSEYPGPQIDLCPDP